MKKGLYQIHCRPVQCVQCSESVLSLYWCVCGASHEHFEAVVLIRPSVKGMFANTEFAFTYKIHLKDKKSAFFPGERTEAVREGRERQHYKE